MYATVKASRKDKMQCPSTGFRTAVFCALKAATHPYLNSCFHKLYSPSVGAVLDFPPLIKCKCIFEQ